MRKRELILIGFLLLVYFIQKLFMYRLGIYMEECRDGNAHLMVFKGMVPYRDFHSWVYGPFVFCVYPLIFKLFGVSLGILRLSYVAAGSLVIPIVYCLSRRLMTPAWASVSAFLSIVLIDVPYYTYNHIFATIAGLLALLFVIKFTEAGRVYYLFLAGVLTGTAVLVKPFAEGFGTFVSIFLFMLFVKFQKDPVCKIKFAHPAAVFAGTLLALAPCAVYFAVVGGLNELLNNTIPFGPHKPSSFYVYTGHPLSLEWLRAHLKYFMSILPYRALFSNSQRGTTVIGAYYSLLLYSPVMFPSAIFLLNRYPLRKYNLISKAALSYIFLFAVFSILISGQALLLFGRMGRSFTMPASFILITYFLFLVNNKKLYKGGFFPKYLAAALSGCFIVYLSFLHFFYNPYSRNKIYTHSLPFARAKGIKVTYPEKQLYEGLNKFLSIELRADDPIAVIGYYPQFAFLLNRENLFGDIEDIWIKFCILPAGHHKAVESEDCLITRLKLKKPKIIISPVITGRKYLPGNLNGYIDKNYALAKVFGPAYIDTYTKGIVNAYKSKD